MKINLDYIEELKKVVAKQAKCTKQTEQALAKAKKFNLRSQMVTNHIDIYTRFYRKNEAIDNWAPNL